MSEDFLITDNSDTFTTYTVFKATAKLIKGGFLSSYLQQKDKDPLLVDFESDFTWFVQGKQGWIGLITNRISLSMKVLWDLAWLLTVVYAVHS